jgi:uroporphyrinogen-III synthase
VQRLPPGRRPRLACIGEATAELARAAGLSVDRVPDAATPEFVVEALESGGSLAGARVLLPRSEAAQDAIPEALRARGAQVDCVVAYRNVLPAGAAERLAAALEPPPSALLLTSPSTVERLVGLIGRDALARLAEQAVLVCIGPSTQSALLGQGITRSVCAEASSSAAMVRALERYYAGHGLP